MRPQAWIDRDQEWFWTSEWQEGERRASDDIREGRTTFYEDGDDFRTALKARRRAHADL
ncbi:MAG: hypothetical protein ABR529_01085 [Actinomycetota bacterium]